MAKATEPLLNLDTLVERALVRIDGVDYELLSPGELSIFDLHKFGQAGSEFDELKVAGIAASKDVTPEMAGAISRNLDMMVRIVLRAPDELLSKLTDAHRFKIISAFNSLTPSSPPVAAVSKSDAGKPRAPRTGARS